MNVKFWLCLDTVTRRYTFPAGKEKFLRLGLFLKLVVYSHLTQLMICLFNITVPSSTQFSGDNMETTTTLTSQWVYTFHVLLLDHSTSVWLLLVFLSFFARCTQHPIRRVQGFFPGVQRPVNQSPYSHGKFNP